MPTRHQGHGVNIPLVLLSHDASLVSLLFSLHGLSVCCSPPRSYWGKAAYRDAALDH